MSGYKIVKATRCENALMEPIVKLIKETIKAKPYHNTILLNLVTLRKDCDINKALEERLKEEMPDMGFTVDVGNVTELIIRWKRKEHFSTLMWKGEAK